MSSLFQDKDGEKKKIKDKIVFYAEEIARYGGSLGLCLINSLQRPTRDNMSPLIKSQCTTVISFRQNNSKSSEVAVDDPSLALGLEQREFVYRLASKDIEYGIVPWVKDIELEKIIKPFKKPHRTLFDDLEKLSKRNGVKKNRESIVEVGTHIKTEKEILEENKAKNPNWVEYENPTGMTIIDKTKLPSKTDKPIKKGREKIC
jgi:S-DNA-T family DNA segregation ATPase FtsK/SpoIIIE